MSTSTKTSLSDTEAPEWLMDVCDKDSVSDLPLHRPFALKDGDIPWTVATDRVLMLALKGATGYGPTGNAKFDAALLKKMRPDGEWKPIVQDVFGAFFGEAETLCNRAGRIGAATIDRGRVRKVMFYLDWREMEYLTTDDPKAPVYFRGRDWLMAVAPLDPDTLTIPDFEEWTSSWAAKQEPRHDA